MSLISEMVSAGVQSHRAQAMQGSVATGLTATGTNQATGYALTKAINVFGTVAAGTAASLPALPSGDSMVVRNGGANALLVCPPVGGTINGAATDAALSVASGKTVQLISVAANGLTLIAIVSA